jgi:predicted MFS family arabinose efflux permease
MSISQGQDLDACIGSDRIGDLHQGNAIASKHQPEVAYGPWLAVVSIAMGTFVLVTGEFLLVGLIMAVPGLAAAIAAPALIIATVRTDRRFALRGLTELPVISNLIVALASNLTFFGHDRREMRRPVLG